MSILKYMRSHFEDTDRYLKVREVQVEIIYLLVCNIKEEVETIREIPIFI